MHRKKRKLSRLSRISIATVQKLDETKLPYYSRDISNISYVLQFLCNYIPTNTEKKLALSTVSKMSKILSSGRQLSINPSLKMVGFFILYLGANFHAFVK